MEHLKWAVMVAVSCSSKVPRILKNKHIQTHLQTELIFRNSSSMQFKLLRGRWLMYCNLHRQELLAPSIWSHRGDLCIGTLSRSLHMLRGCSTLSAACGFYLWKFHDLVTLWAFLVHPMWCEQTVLKINYSRNSNTLLIIILGNALNYPKIQGEKT